MPESKANEKKTTYVLDTSVLIHDPSCIDSFEDNVIVVPLRVVEELDEVKGRADAIGAYAREASRVLEKYRKSGDLRKDGVPTDKGGLLYIAYGAENWDALNGLGRGLERKNDNLILLVAKNWQKHNPDQKVIIITQDTNMRIKAAALDMVAEEYLHGIKSNLNELYTGHDTINIEDDFVFQQFSSALHRNGSCEANMLEEIVDPDSLYPNQCCTIRCKERYILSTFNKQKFEFVYVAKPSKYPKESTIRPKNDSQTFALSLAIDPDISLLTLLGRAGAGKTLIALWAAYQLMPQYYKRIIVYRPIYEVGGKELGYLPGDIDKKFGPWARPIMDNLELIFDDDGTVEFSKENTAFADDNIEIETDRGVISISPIIFIRGRSLHDSFVIVDEAQNLSPMDVKSLVTRAGRGTKVVITGDPTQIDNRYLDSGSNGLVRAIQSFHVKGWEKFAHIKMEKSERSELADISAEIL